MTMALIAVILFMALVGHSMGIISRLMITDTDGEKVWRILNVGLASITALNQWGVGQASY